MAAKGAIVKKEITQTLLQTFPGSFLYNDGKEIRIPGIEDGQEVQIKISLTCAKENVQVGAENAIPGEKTEILPKTENKNQDTVVEPTQEEKENVQRLASMLGL